MKRLDLLEILLKDLLLLRYVQQHQFKYAVEYIRKLNSYAVDQ